MAAQRPSRAAEPRRTGRGLRRRIARALPLSLSAASLWAAGCGAELPVRSPPPSLEITLRVVDDAGAERLEFDGLAPIGFELIVVNTGEQTRTLTSPDAATCDFAVSDASGREVWRWSRGKRFAQVITPLELAPGERKRFTASWDPRGARAGRYTVAGQLRAADEAKARAAFAIRGGE